VLAKANRVVRGADYRLIVRRGRRYPGPNTVTYVLSHDTDAAPRFGFIVAKNVGGAVVRNRVRRRLKAASWELLSQTRPGTDIVVRALPGAASASWASLRGELTTAIERGAALA
jgi:ribonuclease P protein component